MRPQIRAGPKPGHVIATPGSAKGPWPKRGNVVVYVMPSLRACGARPSRGAKRNVGRLAGKARRQRGRRFCRRDALCASANTGRTETGACHDRRG